MDLSAFVRTHTVETRCICLLNHTESFLSHYNKNYPIAVSFRRISSWSLNIPAKEIILYFVIVCHCNCHEMYQLYCFIRNIHVFRTGYTQPHIHVSNFTCETIKESLQRNMVLISISCLNVFVRYSTEYLCLFRNSYRHAIPTRFALQYP